MLTRGQRAGIEPMVKVQKKFRKKRTKKVHSNWLQMILLLPIFLYMNHREASYMLMRIEQRRLQNLNTKQDTSDDDDFNLNLEDDSDDDDVPFSVLCAQQKLDFTNTSLDISQGDGEGVNEGDEEGVNEGDEEGVNEGDEEGVNEGDEGVNEGDEDTTQKKAGPKTNFHKFVKKKRICCLSNL